MTPRRHGGRLRLGLVAGWLGLSGCGGSAADRPAPTLAIRPVAPDRPVVLKSPAGSGPVRALAWGGRRLAVLWAGGRFALYQPDRSPSPIADGRDEGATALAVVAADRLA